MDPKESNFEDEEFGEENEEANDSEKNNDEEDAEDSSKKDDQPGSDNQDDKDEDLSSKYRPSKGEKKKPEEMVPLSKYLDVKKALKRYKDAGGSPSLTNKTLETFAEEAGLKLDVVQDLVKIITAQAREEASRTAEEKIKPIVLEKISRSNLDAFDQDFERTIAQKYPQLVNKKETFKKVAFSKDFLHLTNLEAIRQEFFPDSKPVEKPVKKETVEGGSKGGGKESEQVDFSTLKDNPAQYAKVMKDPALRAKYYKWQDGSSQL